MTDESPLRRPPFPRSPRSDRPADDRHTSGASTAAPSGRAGRLVPAALIVLSAVPMAAGAVRLTELTGGAEITPENARFFAAPLPVVLHILSVCLYSVLGAFQFAPAFRRRRPGRHRVVGRLLVPCGLVAALSGLWMTLFYPRPDGDGDLLTGFRLLFGSAMALAVVLGFAAIRRRDVARHRAWMIRGYAIGLGAGTQVLTHLPWVLVFGTPGELPRALLMAAGWMINVAVAEWVIRRRPATRPAPLPSPAGAPAGGPGRR
ncbi:hypothetical protein GCM10010517_27000 [Streptosporangium fragile]|uniref:DUF2306 domain-containing protein n=1 Tax=Streptosporangium fragile TaxID=46186 RepID=A0ABN3VYK3_9ACTN